MKLGLKQEAADNLKKSAGKLRKVKGEEKKGIFGDAVDYNTYKMSQKDTLTGFAIGFVLGVAAMYIVYDSVLAGLILGLGCGVAGVPLWRKRLLKKQKERLILQFRDLMEALTTSLRTGRNSRNSFVDAEQDLISQYGPDADIVREVRTILQGINNGYREEEMLDDFADRSGIEDVRTFAMVYRLTNHSGGDISQVIDQTHAIISQKLSVEMEIQTTITEAKSQMNIMAIMPFAIILLLRFMGNEQIVSNEGFNLIVKTVAMGIFAGSYLIGQRISNIKV